MKSKAYHEAQHRTVLVSTYIQNLLQHVSFSISMCTLSDKTQTLSCTPLSLNVLLASFPGYYKKENVFYLTIRFLSIRYTVDISLILECLLQRNRNQTLMTLANSNLWIFVYCMCEQWVLNELTYKIHRIPCTLLGGMYC